MVRVSTVPRDEKVQLKNEFHFNCTRGDFEEFPTKVDSCLLWSTIPKHWCVCHKLELSAALCRICKLNDFSTQRKEKKMYKTREIMWHFKFFYRESTRRPVEINIIRYCVIQHLFFVSLLNLIFSCVACIGFINGNHALNARPTVLSVHFRIQCMRQTNNEPKFISMKFKAIEFAVKIKWT